MGFRDLADARRFAPHGAAGQPCAPRQGAGLPRFRGPGHPGLSGAGPASRPPSRPSAARPPAIRFRTPTAVVGVRGTAFRVGSDSAAGTAQAEVTGGEVRMSPPGTGRRRPCRRGSGPSPGPGQPSRRRVRCCGPQPRRHAGGAGAGRHAVSLRRGGGAVRYRAQLPATRLSTTW